MVHLSELMSDAAVSLLFLIYCLLFFDDMSGTDHSSAPSIGALHNNEERENVNFSFFFLVDFKQFFFRSCAGSLSRSILSRWNQQWIFFANSLIHIFIHDTSEGNFSSMFDVCMQFDQEVSLRCWVRVHVKFNFFLLFSAFRCFAILERETRTELRASTSLRSSSSVIMKRNPSRTWSAFDCSNFAVRSLYFFGCALAIVIDFLDKGIFAFSATITDALDAAYRWNGCKKERDAVIKDQRPTWQWASTFATFSSNFELLAWCILMFGFWTQWKLRIIILLMSCNEDQFTLFGWQHSNTQHNKNGEKSP